LQAEHRARLSPAWFSSQNVSELTAVKLDLRKSAAALVGVTIVGIIYVLMQPPVLESSEREELTSRFKFTRLQLPEPTTQPWQNVRKVHPSLQHIAAWISATGAGIALTDLDGDGLSNDYVQTEPRTNEVLVGPLPGTGDRFPRFAMNISSVRYDPERMAPMGTVCGDLNEDGLTDVVVYFWGRTPIAFLRVAGDLNPSSFVAQELVPGTEIWNTSTGLLADLDGDGHCDLLFGNYFQDGAAVLDPTAKGKLNLQDTTARSFNGGKKHILLAVPPDPKDPHPSAASLSPSVHFRHVQDTFPPDINGGWVIAMGCADLDGDLKPEIYFAHDVGPDRLMQNHSKPGSLSFSKVGGTRDWFTPSSFVLGHDSYKGMGIEFADVNYDSVPDIYVSNIAAPFGLEESHFMWVSKTGTAGAYKQSSESLGLSRSGWGWDCRLADFNNDSIFEGVQAMGFIKGNVNKWPELQSLGTTNSTMLSDPANWPAIRVGDDVSGDNPNCFFVRSKSGRFFDIAPDLGLDDAMLGRGIAIADVDGDGDLDFAVANQWSPSFLFRNDSQNTGQSLELTGLPVGAKATVGLSDGRLLSAQVDGGNGHTGRRAQELHFGLGKSVPQKLPVEVQWLSTAGLQTRNLLLPPGRHAVEL
jgi:hypothetical protein